MIYHHILDKSLDHIFGTQFFKFQVVIVIHKGQLMSYAMKMQNVIVKLMLLVVNVWNVLLAIFPFPHAMKVKANSIHTCIVSSYTLEGIFSHILLF